MRCEKYALLACNFSASHYTRYYIVINVLLHVCYYVVLNALLHMCNEMQIMTETGVLSYRTRTKNM